MILENKFVKISQAVLSVKTAVPGTARSGSNSLIYQIGQQVLTRKKLITWVDTVLVDNRTERDLMVQEVTTLLRKHENT